MQGIRGIQPMPIRTAMKMFLCMAVVQGFTNSLWQMLACVGFLGDSVHYVSEKPCEIEDHVHMVGNSEERAQFGAQSAQTGNVYF